MKPELNAYFYENFLRYDVFSKQHNINKDSKKFYGSKTKKISEI